MKANELRIGNLVFLNGELYQMTIQTFEDIGQSEYDEEDFTPIPLTEKWLTDFGFEFSKSVWFYLENCPYELTGGIFTLRLKGLQDFYFFLDLEIGCKIKYVHQLQNLYFSFTGVELTLKK